MIYLGIGVMDAYESPCGHRKLNADPLQDLQGSTAKSWFQTPCIEALMSARFLLVDKIPGMCNLQRQSVVFNHTFNILIHRQLFTVF